MTGARADASAPGLETALLATTSELERLEPEWTALHAASERATPFQSPAWLLPWTRAFVHGPLRIATARRRDDGALVGLLPLFRHDVDGERRVRLLGAGVSDYLDGVYTADASLEPAAVTATFRELLGGPRDWDLCQLEQLGDEAALRSAPILPASRGTIRLSVETRIDGDGAVPCPRVTLAGARSIAEVVPAGQAARLRRARQRADREGLLVLDVATTPSSARRALRVFFDLHDARWHDAPRDEATDVLARAPVRSFHVAVVPELARAGLLRLYVLRLGDRPIASLYALIDRRGLYCYAQGFDPTFSPLGPGTLLLGAVLEDALALGIPFVDLLRGHEPYKRAWAPVDHVTSERRVRPVP